MKYLDEKSFEEFLINSINRHNDIINDLNFRSTNPNNSDFIKKFNLNNRDEMRGVRYMLHFVRNFDDLMKIDVDDATFRRIAGTFFTDMVNDIMGEDSEEESEG